MVRRPDRWMVPLVLSLFILTTLAAASERVDPRIPQRGEYRYHLVQLSEFNHSNPKAVRWTHSCVDGTVLRVHANEDGDLHIILGDGKHRLVLEVIPTTLLSRRPYTGEKGRACGITRYDVHHKWWELHPLEKWIPQEEE